MAEEKVKIENALSKLLKITEFKTLRGDLKKLLLEAVDEIQKNVSLMSSKISKATDTPSINDNQNLKNLKPKYSDVVKEKINSVQKFPMYKLIVKPKSPGSDVKKEFKENVNPRNLKIGINKLSVMKDGSLVVQTEELNDINKIKANITKSKNLEISEFKKRRPRLIIKDIDEDIDMDNIVDTIIEQNSLNIEKTCIRPVTILQNRHNSKRHMVIEVDKETRKELIGRRLSIGYNKRTAEDYHRIVRCYKCQKFHLNPNECRGTLTCPLCAGEHKKSECKQEELKCSNCVRANSLSLTSRKVDVNHSVMDRQCPCYIEQITRLITKTDY